MTCKEEVDDSSPTRPISFEELRLALQEDFPSYIAQQEKIEADAQAKIDDFYRGELTNDDC